MPFNTRPIGDSPIRRQIAYTINIATSDGSTQSCGSRRCQPNRLAVGSPINP